MSSVEELEVAKAKMDKARQALSDYVSQRISLDWDQNRRMVARATKAQAAFLWANSEMGDGGSAK